MAMDEELFALAKKARENAYAPYSRFSVGAALRTAEGKLHAGANVENAAYPEGCCAEASAIGAMVCNGGRRISRILIVGDSPEPVTPCGGCRQKIREFADSETIIEVCDLNGLKKTYTMDDLLPDSFGPENLK